jgi:signal transduction histidine kinase/ActR/RegA family two-component response regulator
MKLRTYYVVLVLVLVVPAAVFGGIAINMLWHAQHAAALARVQENVRLVRMVIDADIHRAQSVVDTLANSHALATGDMASFYEELRDANAGPGAWLILYDTSGQQLLNTRHPFGTTLPRRPDPQQVDEMLRSGSGLVSGIKWGAELKNNFVIAEQPISAPSGKRYVLAQAFSPAFFTRAFAGRELPPSWLVGVYDRDGVIIARSREADRFVGKRAKPELVKALSSARRGMLRHVNSDGTDVYEVFTQSQLAGWSILIGAPVSEIDGPVWRGASLMAAGLCLAVAAALTLAAIFGRRLVHFVASASAAARRLGQGGQVALLAPVHIHELDELNGAIREADLRLREEMRSRARAEHERNELLVLEQQARAKAESQNEAKDEFLAMLGHELRNPLSAIANAVRVLDSSRPVAEATAVRVRQVLLRQTNHLAKLVDDLLEVNRVLMGKFTLDLMLVHLDEVVKRSVDALQSSGRTAGFDVRVQTVAATIRADPTRLVQIVDNVLDNALKYSPEGGLLEITVQQMGDHAELVVRDSGIGIAAELLPTVFDMFVQARQPLQRAQGGLGIGLSLVRRLVSLHNGRVAIASPGLGHGATVTIGFPLLAGVLPQAAAAVTPALAPRRVLLVEDNDDAREMMAMLLETCGCQVLTAADGGAGIELAIAQLPDLALIDIGLAGADGYAVARELKRDPRTRHIPLIALTGYGSERDREQALAAGFTRHFTKPISLEHLHAALEHATSLLPAESPARRT